jgi:hypothetical protein
MQVLTRAPSPHRYLDSLAYRILPLAALGEKEWAELTKLQGDLLYDKGDLREALEAYGRLLREHKMAAAPPASMSRTTSPRPPWCERMGASS